ncbi:MAG: hypothetical protein M1819_005676, partial [Sarea resinae]
DGRSLPDCPYGESDSSTKQLQGRVVEAEETLIALEAELAAHLAISSPDQRRLGTVQYHFRAPSQYGEEHLGDIGDFSNNRAGLTPDVRQGLDEKSVVVDESKITRDWGVVRSLRRGQDLVNLYPITAVGAIVPGAPVKKIGRTTGLTTGTILRHRIFACMKGNWVRDSTGKRRRIITRKFAVGSDHQGLPRQVFSD